MSDAKKLSPVEHIKLASNYLRGGIADGLADEMTASIAEDDTQLTKFYGFYQQDNRDLRSERKTSRLEPHYQFMLRLRLPSGVVTGEQYLAIDELAHKYGNGTLRLTTRQTFQFHGVAKWHLRPLLQDAYKVGVDARGACGDVNRNVMVSAHPERSAVHAELHAWSQKISEHLAWKSRAYEEIFLQQEPRGEDHEPIYGTSYLPRKFKIAMAIPPENDVDVFANDIGLIAIIDNGELAGFNVAVGGGMGTTHGEEATYPRLGSIIGFVAAENVMQVVETLVTIQRDYGDRENRKHARFKYTIDDRGLDWLQAQLAERADIRLAPARDYRFARNNDPIGWFQSDDGAWHLTLFVENGRIADFTGEGESGYKLMTGIREIAKIHAGTIRLTGNHNVIIAGVAADNKPAIEAIVAHYNLDDGNKNSLLRHSSMACVAFPTCGLAMAESERYMPRLITKLDAVMNDAGLADTSIVMRMTGCPNGCARPFLGEIGFVGKAPGKYNLYLGAAHNGSRLNKLYRETIGEDEILAELTPMINRYAAERENGESFGDFVIRAGIIAETTEGRLFHEHAGALEAA